jgi:hypothetical protein
VPEKDVERTGRMYVTERKGKFLDRGNSIKVREQKMFT